MQHRLGEGHALPIAVREALYDGPAHAAES